MPGLPDRSSFCMPSRPIAESYDSLSALVRETPERNVLDGGLFVFLNQRRNRIKLLYWDRDGLAIWQKRLEQGTFICGPVAIGAAAPGPAVVVATRAAVGRSGVITTRHRRLLYRHAIQRRLRKILKNSRARDSS
jgi:transposase